MALYRMPSLPCGRKPNMKTLDPLFSAPISPLNFIPFQDRFRFFTLPPATFCSRESKLHHASGLHLDTVSWLHRRLVVAVLNHRRMLEVLMEMIHVLQNALLATDAHVINGTQMLRVFWQSHTSRVRNNRGVELLSH